MTHAEFLAPAPARRRKHAADTVPPALATLIDELDAACAEGVIGGRIVTALKQAAARADVLTADQCIAQAGCYARHAIYSDPSGRFTIVAIVWGGGQFSPTHAHHAWCAYAVHEGTLQETLYAWDGSRDSASGRALPLRTEVRSPGYGCYAPAGLDQIHRLGNAGTEPAISIHVYGVERERIATHVNRVVQVG
jgi:predicted metal-dependent enzyme (double-stranded beta helix superfamily)